MTWNRYAKKSDTNQDEIVSALRKVGILVAIIGRPVDLLTYYPAKRRFLPLEIKRAKKRPRKEQEAQNAFIGATGCPVVTSALAAIEAVTRDPA